MGPGQDEVQQVRLEELGPRREAPGCATGAAEGQVRLAQVHQCVGLDDVGAGLHRRLRRLLREPPHPDRPAGGPHEVRGGLVLAPQGEQSGRPVRAEQRLLLDDE